MMSPSPIGMTPREQFIDTAITVVLGLAVIGLFVGALVQKAGGM